MISLKKSLPLILLIIHLSTTNHLGGGGGASKPSARISSKLAQAFPPAAPKRPIAGAGRRLSTSSNTSGASSVEDSARLEAEIDRIHAEAAAVATEFETTTDTLARNTLTARYNALNQRLTIINNELEDYYQNAACHQAKKEYQEAVETRNSFFKEIDVNGRKNGWLGESTQILRELIAAKKESRIPNFTGISEQATEEYIDRTERVEIKKRALEDAQQKYAETRRMRAEEEDSTSEDGLDEAASLNDEAVLAEYETLLASLHAETA